MSGSFDLTYNSVTDVLRFLTSGWALSHPYWKELIANVVVKLCNRGGLNKQAKFDTAACVRHLHFAENITISYLWFDAVHFGIHSSLSL